MSYIHLTFGSRFKCMCLALLRPVVYIQPHFYLEDGMVLSCLVTGQPLLNPILSGLFQTVNDPGGGALKAPPPPLRSRKLSCQSSPYHTCEFYQVFLA